MEVKVCTWTGKTASFAVPYSCEPLQMLESNNSAQRPADSEVKMWRYGWGCMAIVRSCPGLAARIFFDPLTMIVYDGCGWSRVSVLVIFLNIAVCQWGGCLKSCLLRETDPRCDSTQTSCGETGEPYAYIYVFSTIVVFQRFCCCFSFSAEGTGITSFGVFPRLKPFVLCAQQGQLLWIKWRTLPLVLGPREKLT